MDTGKWHKSGDIRVTPWTCPGCASATKNNALREHCHQVALSGGPDLEMLAEPIHRGVMKPSPLLTPGSQSPTAQRW